MRDYDPHERRDTPLSLVLKARIERDGPISVAQYMHACLYDPAHGYYVTQPAIGAKGDFITAPEISQVFGELIGLWCAVVWQQMGAPATFNLVEVGPGRGTLMTDALRALAKVQDCLTAARVRLVEVSPALRELQRARLSGIHHALSWHASLDDGVEALPTIVVANEVIDAQPVEQLAGLVSEPSNAGFVERCVRLDEAERLQFCTRCDGIVAEDKPESISERRDLHPLVGQAMSTFPAVVALIIDYGHVKSNMGDTLQAVRGHAFEHPLASPGEADLSAHVDFEDLALQARNIGFEVDGPVTQAELLGALGIAERASRLMSANPQRAGEIEAGIARLMSPTGMGTRFKAIGLRSPRLPALPGFPSRRVE